MFIGFFKGNWAGDNTFNLIYGRCLEEYPALLQSHSSWCLCQRSEDRGQIAQCASSSVLPSIAHVRSDLKMAFYHLTNLVTINFLISNETTFLPSNGGKTQIINIFVKQVKLYYEYTIFYLQVKDKYKHN